jgi:hypothetical protein
MEMKDFDNMLLCLPLVHGNLFEAIKPMSPSDSMLSMLENDDETSNIIKFEKKTPIWSEKRGSFVLNFGQRVKKPSVKNTQLLKITKPGVQRDCK